MTTPRVVIIGGGITGLAAAFTLHAEANRRRAPLSLTLLEASASAGGHATTAHVDGCVIEAGPNGFLSREPETLALIEEAGLTPRLVEAKPESRRRFILHRGRLRLVPTSPVSLVTSDALSWRGKLRLLGEPLAPAAPLGVEETVHQFASRRLGREAADTLVDAAVAGISAGNSRALSAPAQFPSLIDMEREHGGLLRAMLARRGRKADGAGPPRLLSFDRGLGVLTSTLAAALGSSVRTRATVRSIDQIGTGWRIAVNDDDAVDADRVIVAAPAPAAARMLHSLDGRVAATLGEIPYAGLTVVALAYAAADVPRPLDGYGYLVTAAEAMATLGVVWESSLFPGRTPEGTALFRVFLGGSRRPEVAEMDTARVTEIARTELERVMGMRARPAQVQVTPWPRAIAQYTIGHQARRDAIRAQLAAYPGIDVCGTAYDGVSFNDAIVSGRRAARAAGAALWAVPADHAAAPASAGAA